MTNPELEEKLREAACFGDIDGVKELMGKGVNVNSQHDINGWTALHWAAKRNHLNIVNLLCNHGADKNITTNKGETAATLTTEGVIKVLLNAQKGGAAAVPGQRTPDKDVKREASQKPLAIVPNYIRDPPLAYQVDIGDRSHIEKKARLEPDPRDNDYRYNRRAAPNPSRQDFSRQQELIVKARVAGAAESDFIEVDLPRSALTLEYLIVLCSEELGVSASGVERVRKLPNTRLRRDKEVTRLVDYQELEFIMKEEEVVAVAEAEKEVVEEKINNGKDAVEDSIEEAMAE